LRCRIEQEISIWFSPEAWIGKSIKRTLLWALSSRSIER
jgi:hypothetical protein